MANQKPLKLLTFDSESNGLLEEADRVWCIVVKDHDDGKSYSYGPDNLDAGLAHLATGDVLIGHNILGHDFPLFKKLYGWTFRGKKVDTLLMSRVQRPNRKSPPHCPNKRAPHSLDAWGYRVGLGKVVHEDWTQFTPEMLHRCERDVEINHLTYFALLEEGKGEGWAPAHRLNMRLFELLQQQEQHGWAIDVPYMDSCIRQLDRWIVRIAAAIHDRLPLLVDPLETKERGEYKWVKKPFKKDGSYAQIAIDYFGDSVDCVGGPFSRVGFRHVDLDSNAETKDYLLSVGWVPLEWNYNDDGERTSAKLSKDDPFEGVQGSLGRLIAKRVKCRHRRGQLAGLREAVDSNGIIHPQVSGIADTGRMKHALVVNIPSVDAGAFYAKQMRSCFIARPGMVMVGADSKGNQVRQLAARMGDPEFTRAVLHGSKETNDDHHSLTQKASGVPTRTLAKNVFYGTVFGAQDAKIGKIVGGSKEDGKRVRENLFRGLPKLKELVDRLTEEWMQTAVKYWDYQFKRWSYKDGYIKGIDGRPILVDSPHKLLNYALQSDEAIQMAYAYVLVHDWCKERGWVYGRDWAMLIWYHDEFQTEALPNLAQDLGQLMCDAIKEAGLYYKIECPHDGDFRVGSNWKETH